MLYLGRTAIVRRLPPLLGVYGAVRLPQSYKAAPREVLRVCMGPARFSPKLQGRPWGVLRVCMGAARFTPKLQGGPREVLGGLQKLCEVPCFGSPMCSVRI